MFQRCKKHTQKINFEVLNHDVKHDVNDNNTLPIIFNILVQYSLVYNILPVVSDKFSNEKKQLLEVKSYEIVDKGNHEDNTINTVRENQSPPEVKALIPLPPKPRYSYLIKWLLKK